MTKLRCVLFCFLAAACHANDDPFWRDGARYRLTLVARERPALLPSTIEFHKPIRDTLVLHLTADSIRGSRVYGSYSGQVRGFAVRLGFSDAAREFRADLAGDSVALALAPRVSDGQLRLDGAAGSDAITGAWFSQAPPRTRGVFTLNRLGGAGRVPER